MLEKLSERIATDFLAEIWVVQVVWLIDDPLSDDICDDDEMLISLLNESMELGGWTVLISYNEPHITEKVYNALINSVSLLLICILSLKESHQTCDGELFLRVYL